jgi:hypothetical protein
VKKVFYPAFSVWGQVWLGFLPNLCRRLQITGKETKYLRCFFLDISNEAGIMKSHKFVISSFPVLRAAVVLSAKMWMMDNP